MSEVTPIPPGSRVAKAANKPRLYEVRKIGPAVGAVGEQAAQDSPIGNSMPAPSTTFDGVGNLFGGAPPDTNGDVGPDHYMQWINVAFQIFNKNGTSAYGPANGNTLFAPGTVCGDNNDGDPIVLYDQYAGRWFASQFALPNFPAGPWYQCIAVSSTNSPLGSWCTYQAQVHATKMNDYPKFGIWPSQNGYFMTVNQFNQNNFAWGGTGIYVFERDKMLACQTARFVYKDMAAVDINLGGMLPADADGSAAPVAGAPNPILVFDDTTWGYTQDQIEVWNASVNWAPATPALTVTKEGNLATAAFESDVCLNYNRECIPQPGTTRKLDAISDRLLHRLAWRKFADREAMVVTHSVDAGSDRAGVRWYEFTRTTGNWSIRQQSTYAPADGLHRWMGSAAMDQNGNMAVGYSVGSATTFPGIRYTGRLVGDPLNTLPQGEATLWDGGGSQTGFNRWGDYSSMSVDPTNDCTFWYTQEYFPSPTSSAGWKTRIGTFTFPGCPPTPPVMCLGSPATITGTAAGETLTGTPGNDVIAGLNGDDVLVGGGGDDKLCGGDGADTADFSSSSGAVTANLTAGTATGQGADTFNTIERLTGSPLGDTLTGDGGPNTLNGGNGADTLAGAAATDTLNGDDGNDTLRGGLGDDALIGGNGTADKADYSTSATGVTASLTSNSSTGEGTDSLATIENLTGSNQVDTLTGNGGNNQLVGFGQNDTLNGEGGADLLLGRLGDDQVNGGDGPDTADFSQSPAGVTATTSGSTGEGTDAFTGIENLAGSPLDDSLTGDAGINALVGAGGNDTLTGGANADTLRGRAGDDTLDGGLGADVGDYTQAPAGVTVSLSVAGPQPTGSDGTDTLVSIEHLGGSPFGDMLTGADAIANILSGNGGNDNLDGKSGNDNLRGGPGNDTFTGGLGTDVVDFSLAAAGITATLDGTATGEGTDTLNPGIEWLFGSRFNDTLTGDGFANRLEGRNGDDTLNGLAGNDILIGGANTDTLDGGANTDTCDGETESNCEA